MMMHGVLTPGLVLLDPVSLIALAMVVIVGLPHGAFDGAIARHLGYGRDWRGLAMFMALYLGLVVAVIAFWLWQPSMALAFFLVISAMHFGYGDATALNGFSRMVQIAAHGSVVVFGISLFHLEQVTPIFAVLTDGDFAIALMMTQLFPLFILPVTTLYFGLAIRHATLRPRLIELALLCLLFSIAPPLVGFAVYFCVIHTGRHMRHIWQRVRTHATPRHLMGQAALFTLGSWAGAIMILVWLDSGNFSHDLLRVIFIGLAALTVPHMILVDGLFRRRDEKDVM
jgi:Brp/Blh family beta-carotene 15,15'-monooxygenase